MSGQNCALACLLGHSPQARVFAHALRCVAVECSCPAIIVFGQNVAELLASLSVAPDGVY